MNIFEYLRQKSPPVFALPVDGERIKEFFEVPQLLFVGRFMDPVYGGKVFLKEMACHCLVRGDHELLDDLVREKPLRPEDIFDAAFDIEYHLRLRQIEIKGASPRPPFLEGKGKFPHVLQVGHNISQL